VRFRIDVGQDWRAVVRCPELGLERPPRQMRGLDDGEGGRFPLPPLDEMDAVPSGEACRNLCHAGEATAIWAARASVVNRRIDGPATLATFGHYLFHCLLGAENWNWISGVVADHRPESIELALCWERTDANLNRLNWELMHDGRAYLVKGLPEAAVAITRIVAGTSDPRRWTPRQMEFPPRVLFVFGTALNDPDVRPEAEFLGLLRQLERSGRRIHARVLEKATPRELQRVVEVFKPHVVHFICHGDWDRETGRGYLQLETDDEGADPRRFADQLVGSLVGSFGLPPSAVVLSACHTGSSGVGPAQGLKGVHETAPLATELVEHGIPIVLAMAGRVADRACRLFTRSFGESLVLGETLVAATAAARKASWVEGGSSVDSVDWAFPALFLAEAVPPDYAPVPADAAADLTPDEQWVAGYDLERLPVFCGRTDLFQAYHGLLQPGGRRVLGIAADPGKGLGKTRLLLELAIETLRSGNVPVVVSSEWGGWTPPGKLTELAKHLRDGIRRAREAIQLPGGSSSQLGALMRPVAGGVDLLDHDIRELVDDAGGEVTAAALRMALQRDFFRLAKDARAQAPDARPDGRVVVLLDSVELYGEVTTVLFEQLLGPHGMGTVDDPVPAILVFSMQPPANITLQWLLERFENRPWFQHLDLKPFNKANDEDVLAYEWMLVHPTEEGAPAYVLNDRVAPNMAITVREFLQEWFKGIPGEFADAKKFSSFTRIALNAQYLLEADDDRLLQSLRNRRGVAVSGAGV
jgi:CHAT domain